MAVRAVCAGAALWRQMTPEERQQWVILAEAGSRRYRQQKAERARRAMLNYVRDEAQEQMLLEME